MSRLLLVAAGFTANDPERDLPRTFRVPGWRLSLHPGLHLDAEDIRAADLVVVNAHGDGAVELTARLGRRAGPPAVWLAHLDRPQPPGLLEHLGGDWPLWVLLPFDAPAWAVISTCRALVAAHQRLRASERQASQLARRLEDRKVIERAKGILMEHFELSESEAYQRMRATAMRQRKNLREIARNVMVFAEGEDPD